AAAAANVVPLCSCNQTTGFSVVGAPPYPPGEGPEVDWRVITPGYLSALRIPLIRGRDFTTADGPDAPPVMLVNETVSRRWFPDGGARPSRSRSEEHTSELQSRGHLVCRLLLEKKKIVKDKQRNNVHEDAT